MSTKALSPFAEYTCGAQPGSDASYTVTLPCVITTRLGPGCVCQPLLPPASHVFCWMYMSVEPFVFNIVSQTVAGFPALGSAGTTVWALMSSGPSVDFATVVLVKPAEMVARTLPPYTAAP